jgi:hypothetical protein
MFLTSIQVCHDSRGRCKTRHFCLSYLKNASKDSLLPCAYGTSLTMLTIDELWKMAIHTYRLHLNLYSSHGQGIQHGPTKFIAMLPSSRILFVVPGTHLLLTYNINRLFASQTITAWNTETGSMIKQWPDFPFIYFLCNYHLPRLLLTGKVRFVLMQDMQ